VVTRKNLQRIAPVLGSGTPIAFTPHIENAHRPKSLGRRIRKVKNTPQGESIMTVATKDKRTQPMGREVARRQASVRNSWTPGERRERARQASAQMSLLWAMIQPCNK
jgi:hypothetical protein